MVEPTKCVKVLRWQTRAKHELFAFDHQSKPGLKHEHSKTCVKRPRLKHEHSKTCVKRPVGCTDQMCCIPIYPKWILESQLFPMFTSQNLQTYQIRTKKHISRADVFRQDSLSPRQEPARLHGSAPMSKDLQIEH